LRPQRPPFASETSPDRLSALIRPSPPFSRCSGGVSTIAGPRANRRDVCNEVAAGSTVKDRPSGVRPASGTINEMSSAIPFILPAPPLWRELPIIGPLCAARHPLDVFNSILENTASSGWMKTDGSSRPLQTSAMTPLVSIPRSDGPFGRKDNLISFHLERRSECDRESSAAPRKTTYGLPRQIFLATSLIGSPRS